ncbi:TPA: hypothetical protein DCX16_02050 [bacterium]|nr:hypothetical protein [bacterium]
MTKIFVNLYYFLVMAIYTYLCNKCEYKFDIIYGREEPICNKCGSSDTKKTISLPMIKTSRYVDSSCSGCIKTTCSGCK